MATTTPIADTTPPLSAARTQRLALVDALRAFAATLIAWHHFASYEPFSSRAMSVAAGLLEWLQEYGSVTQVFFVVGGYVMALTMDKRRWRASDLGPFLLGRYLRLGLPYLATVALAMAACQFARGTISEDVIGAPFTVPQILAHVFFLQDILGYESVSAGLWYVCINFQIIIIYVALLFARDFMRTSAAHDPRGSALCDLPLVAGWALFAASLFYFNLDDARWDPWAVYFYAYFFPGVIVYHALHSRRGEWLFGALALLMVAAMIYEWRLRLATSLATAALLLAGGKLGFLQTWPRSRVVAYQGRTSYSFFLVHFSVLVIIATIWTKAGWVSPWQSLGGMLVTFCLSLPLANFFFRFIEEPAEQLSRRIARRPGQ